MSAMLTVKKEANIRLSNTCQPSLLVPAISQYKIILGYRLLYFLLSHAAGRTFKNFRLSTASRKEPTNGQVVTMAMYASSQTDPQFCRDNCFKLLLMPVNSWSLIMSDSFSCGWSEDGPASPNRFCLLYLASSSSTAWSCPIHILVALDVVGRCSQDAFPFPLFIWLLPDATNKPSSVTFTYGPLSISDGEGESWPETWTWKHLQKSINQNTH